MDLLVYQIIFLNLVVFTSTDIVKWLPNLSFNVPANFRDGKLPCSKKTVVFPQSMSGSVGLESIMDVGALILPDDGEIVLENALISLGQDIGDNNCTDGNSYYLDKSISSWNQADVWSSARFNEATPDNERVPCFDDIVEFPPNAKYTVRLPDEEQTVREIRINNSSITATLRFQIYILRNQTDQMGQFIMNNFYNFGVRIQNKPCTDRFGCACQNEPLEIDCGAKYCPEPACVTPIKPKGFCCSLCGGYIEFEIEEGFDVISFKELIEKIVSEYSDKVVYHIGYPSAAPNRKIQLIIAEKGAYSGDSLAAINAIDRNMHTRWYKGQKLTQISGAPLSKRHLGVTLFVSTFFVVIVMFGVIYTYYYRFPSVKLPAGWGGYRSNFFRYQARSDSVVSLTRRDSSMIPVPRTAFRNPLYDSKRGRVQVDETAVEES